MNAVIYDIQIYDIRNQNFTELGSIVFRSYVYAACEVTLSESLARFTRHSN